MKGDAQIEALEKINELLNNIPKKISTVKEKHVTPNENTQRTAQPAKEVALVDKPIPIQMPIPRLQKNTSIEIAAISPLTPRVHSKSKEDISPKQINLRHRIQEATQARLPHRHNMQLHQQEQRECVQLIRDDKTGEYLNYRQLIRNPKHREIWNKSAANEFGRLAQGVGRRVKSTNTIFFIRKDQLPKDNVWQFHLQHKTKQN